MNKKRIFCFVDGFNLFHALDSLGKKYNYLKWLDLNKLVHAFITPSTEQLKQVYYFSAYPVWLPEAHKTHREYVSALEATHVIPILGHFKKKNKRCGAQCRKDWYTYEEKESDVNIAIHILHHAYLNNYDKALIITADSDICPATKLAKGTFPNKEIMVLTPPNRYQIARELRGLVTTRKIKISHLERSLLPATLHDKIGRIVAEMPEKYKKLSKLKIEQI